MDVKRKNGDDGIDYLVNDKDLDLEAISKKRIFIVGERHRNKEDEQMVMDLISVAKPKCVLVEALGDLVLPDKKTKEHQMTLDTDVFYYGGFTKHWIELSLKYPDVLFVGMEYTGWTEEQAHNDFPYKKSFAIREAHFLKMIKSYAKKGTVIAVTGDTHLRSIKTSELGPVSPIYSAYINDSKAVIIRSAKGEIE